MAKRSCVGILKKWWRKALESRRLWGSRDQILWREMTLLPSLGGELVKYSKVLKWKQFDRPKSVECTLKITCKLEKVNEDREILSRREVKVIWTMTSLRASGSVIRCNGNGMGFSASWSLIWISRYSLLVLLPWADNWASGSWCPHGKIRDLICPLLAGLLLRLR